MVLAKENATLRTQLAVAERHLAYSQDQVAELQRRVFDLETMNDELRQLKGLQRG